VERMFVLCLIVISIAGAHAVRAEACDGLEKFALAKQESNEASGFLARIKAVFASTAGVDCASLRVALTGVVDGRITGGRKLEPPTALDRAAAQADVASALQIPGVREKIDNIEKNVTDEDVRLLFEAAVFDDAGSYDARDLRIAQLREKLGVL